MKITHTSGWLSDRCKSLGITRCRIKLSDRIGFDDIGSLRLRLSLSFDDAFLLFRAVTLLCLGLHTFLGLFYVILLCSHHLGSAQVDRHSSISPPKKYSHCKSIFVDCADRSGCSPWVALVSAVHSGGICFPLSAVRSHLHTCMSLGMKA